MSACAVLPTYAAAHQRVRAARGRASAHRCRCGLPARDWAYDHTDPNEVHEIVTGWRGEKRIVAYSPDPARYDARCRGCHIVRDRRVWA